MLFQGELVAFCHWSFGFIQETLKLKCVNPAKEAKLLTVKILLVLQDGGVGGGENQPASGENNNG